MPAPAFDHIAIAIRNIAEAPHFLVGKLGGVPDTGGPGPGYTGGQWAFQSGARLEVIEPDGAPGGFLHRFIDKHGPGIHHVTFKVPSLVQACERARACGYDIVGYDDTTPAWQEAFLHPKQAQGIVVQLVESEPGSTDSWGSDWDFPPGPPDPPPAVRVVGLRMVTGRAEQARRQWSEIAQGTCTEESDGLVFRWAGSPMRIAVRLDENAPEGPFAIEVAAGTPLGLSDTPHPALGTRFVQIPS